MAAKSIFDAFPELKKLRNQVVYYEKQMNAPICPPWFRSFEYDQYVKGVVGWRKPRKRKKPQAVWEQLKLPKPRPQDLPLDFTPKPQPKPIISKCPGLIRHYEIELTASGNWRIVKRS